MSGQMQGQHLPLTRSLRLLIMSLQNMPTVLLHIIFAEHYFLQEIAQQQPIMQKKNRGM